MQIASAYEPNYGNIKLALDKLVANSGKQKDQGKKRNIRGDSTHSASANL